MWVLCVAECGELAGYSSFVLSFRHTARGPAGQGCRRCDFGWGHHGEVMAETMNHNHPPVDPNPVRLTLPSRAHARLAELLEQFHESYGERSGVLHSFGPEIEVIATYGDVDYRLSVARSEFEEAAQARVAAVERLATLVIDWSDRLAHDRPSLDTRRFTKLRRTPHVVLGGGEQLLKHAVGEEAYLESLRAEVEPAVEQLREFIELADTKRMAVREAVARRREVARRIERVVVPYRRALARVLGKGAPPVLALRIKYGRRAEPDPVEPEASASSVSLVAEDPPASTEEGGQALAGEHAEDASEAA